MSRRKPATAKPTSLAARIESTAGKPGGSEWREKARILYEYMMRNMRDSWVMRLRRYPKNGKNHDPRWVPFVWRVVREKTPQHVERNFIGADGQPLSAEELRAIHEVYEAAGIDRAMRSARKQLVALQQSTTWLWPAENNWDLKAFTVPCHKQAVRIGDPTSDDEDSVREWYVEVPTSNDPLTGTVHTGVIRITKETQTWAESLDFAAGAPVWGRDAGKDPAEYDRPLDGLNALGRMPVAMMRGEEPEPGFWWCELPEDLLYAQRALNNGFTTVNVHAEMQGFGQGYIKGMTPAMAKEIEVGAETFVGLPPDAELGFAQPGADLSGTVETINQYMQAVVSAEGLSPQTFLKSTGITALAKRIENQSRDAERRWDMDTIQRAEQRIYDLAREWLRVLRGTDVLPAARVTIEARDMVDVVDPLHDMQALQLAIFSGQTDKAAARAKRDGVGYEEGKRRVLLSLETEAEIEEARAGFGLAPAPVAGGSEAAQPTEVEAATDVQSQALNGAQVTALREVIQSVSIGTLAPDAARRLIAIAFPDVSREDAEALATAAASLEVAPQEVEV
jgi:hypothetical protein